DLGRPPAVERVAGHDVVERLAGLHDLLHDLRDQAAGDVAEVDLGQAEGGLVGGHGDVARGDDGEGAAEAPAVDRGDRRPREVAQLLVAPGVGDAAILLAAAAVVAVLVEVLLEVLAGAEGVAAAGDDEHLGRVVGLQVGERVVHVAVELGAHRVALLGAVEPNGGDAVLLLDEDGRVVGHSGLPSRGRCAAPRRYLTAVFAVVEPAVAPGGGVRDPALPPVRRLHRPDHRASAVGRAGPRGRDGPSLRGARSTTLGTDILAWSSMPL